MVEIWCLIYDIDHQNVFILKHYILNRICTGRYELSILIIKFIQTQIVNSRKASNRDEHSVITTFKYRELINGLLALKKKIRKNTEKLLLIKQQAYVRNIYVWILDRPPI